MATSTLVPVEEYLATHYDPDLEYVDGELVERSVGDVFHSRLQGLIFSAFQKLEESHEVVALVECRMLVRDAPKRRRYRIPDVSLMATPITSGLVLTDPPLVVVEVLSTDDSMYQMMDKCIEYQSRGARHIWIADPRGRVVVWRGTGMEISEQVRLPIPEISAEIPFDEIFNNLWKLGKRPADPDDESA